ncbi:MAG: hypothetical protein FD172_3826 [Methylocystaceae bacterium]|nr:MAG: hypothetical protein FD172_3826 [Methylocystaceae bacterium]
MLKLVVERGHVKGERLGVDGSTMEANAAVRTIVRRSDDETYRRMLERMAKESGIDTPTTADLACFDRKRKDKKLSNAEWKSATDADAKIARMKNGATHLAYKPEYAVDLDTGVIVAATLDETLDEAKANFSAVGLEPTPDDPCEVIADRGYHSRDVLKGHSTAVNGRHA